MEIKKIKPMFNYIVLTADRHDVSTIDGIIDLNQADGSIKEIQKVVAVGHNVRNVKVGDIVAIDPKRYEVRSFRDGSLKEGMMQVDSTYSYNFPSVTIGGVSHLFLTENDITYIVEEYD